MPAIYKRKVIRTGKSRAVTIPAEWLRWVKERYGEVEFVEVEVNDELRIRPHLQK